MQIDWFTFGAQIVNFLILVALLRLFLYKPIIEVMNKREQKITSRLDDAQLKQEEAENEAEEYRGKQRELDERRDELLAKAREQADERRQDLIKQAREDVNDMRSDWHRAIQREKETFLRRLRARVSEEMFALARRALRDLADADLEEQMVNVFARQIATLEGEQRNTILRDSDQVVEVHSTFELSETQRDQLDKLIHEQFDSVDLHYVADSDVICGLALVTDSCQIGWNIHDYLQTLQDNLETFLAAQTLPESEEDGESEDDESGNESKNERVSAEQVARQIARRVAQEVARETLQNADQEE